MSPKSVQPIVVLGPTASGKTAYAHSLCQSLGALGHLAQVVNLDAFQFYRGLSIGTAKPTPQEVKSFGYLGIDFLDPLDRCDASAYARTAWGWCQGLLAKGCVPVVVGGSGLYTRAFLHGLDDLPPQNPALRAHLRERAAQEGWPALHRYLGVLNPPRAAQVHPNDGVRIERALELALSAKEAGVQGCSSKSAPLAEQPLLAPCTVVQLRPPRTGLKTRIASRVQVMLEEGWVQEVEALWNTWGPPLLEAGSFRAIGYRLIYEEVLLGGKPPGAVYETLCQHTWQYARRQLTWNAQEVCHVSVEKEAGAQGPGLDETRELLALFSCV